MTTGSTAPNNAAPRPQVLCSRVSADRSSEFSSLLTRFVYNRLILMCFRSLQRWQHSRSQICVFGSGRRSRHRSALLSRQVRARRRKQLGSRSARRRRTRESRWGTGERRRRRKGRRTRCRWTRWRAVQGSAEIGRRSRCRARSVHEGSVRRQQQQCGTCGIFSREVGGLRKLDF